MLEHIPKSTAVSSWWVYMIATEKGRLYTGITTNVVRRFQEHQDTHLKKPKAKGAKYFRSDKPLSIVFTRRCDNRAEASACEVKIKALSSVDKKQFIAQEALVKSN